MAGLRRKARQFGLHRAKSESARAGFVAVVQVVFAQLKSEFVVVSARDDCHIVHHDGAAVVATAGVGGSEPAARTDAAALRLRALEGERREVRAGDIL